jgi:hypothetical protein
MRGRIPENAGNLIARRYYLICQSAVSVQQRKTGDLAGQGGHTSEVARVISRLSH